MTLAVLLTCLITSLTPGQDPWPALSLKPADAVPDSLAQAGVLVTPSPGALDVVVGLTCQGTPRASYMAHGAVVKIRIQPGSAQAPCSATGPLRAYSAHVGKLKPKR